MQLSKRGKNFNRQLQNQSSKPSKQSSLRMEAAPASEALAERGVWELCSRLLKGCGQVGGTSLCSGKGTGALLWCAYGGEYRGCKLLGFSLCVRWVWFKKPAGGGYYWVRLISGSEYIKQVYFYCWGILLLLGCCASSGRTFLPAPVKSQSARLGCCSIPPHPASPWIIDIQKGQATARASRTFLPSISKGAPDNHCLIVTDKTWVNLLLLQLSACLIKPPLLTAAPTILAPSTYSKDVRYNSKHLQHLCQPDSSHITVFIATA